MPRVGGVDFSVDLGASDRKASAVIDGEAVFSEEVDAKRLTIGINLGFEAKQFYSEIRLNYEDYFKSSLPIHTDKLTLEFIGRF